MEHVCYKCGVPILDNYPSHFCFSCRMSLTAPSEKTLAERLTDSDRYFLRGMKIRVDKDMIPAGGK